MNNMKNIQTTYVYVCYACMHACMNVSLTPVYSRLMRTSKSASPLALPPVHSMNPVLIPHREGPKKRCWGHAGRMVPREVSLTQGCHMGCSGVNRVFWDAYLVRKEVNRSFLLIETHPNSPFFLAFFGPRATVVDCFWKGDCYIRIWESHHVLILTNLGTILCTVSLWPVIWQT